MVINLPGCLNLHTHVAELADILCRSPGHNDLNHVLSVDEEEVYTVGQTAVEQAVTPTQLIVKHAFGTEIGISCAVEIQVFICRITEALTEHELEFACLDGSDNESCLRNPFAACFRMVVITKSGTEGDVFGYLLANVGIASHLVCMPMCALHPSLASRYGGASCLVLIPSASVDMLIVKTCGDARRFSCHHALIERNSSDGIARAEVVCLLRPTCFVAIINAVIAIVVVDAEGAACPCVVVLHDEISRAACDALVVIIFRDSDCTGVAGVEVCDVGHRTCVPMVGQLVSKTEEAAILLKTHVGTMIVRALVLSRNGAREASCTQLVTAFHLHRSPTSSTCIDSGMLGEFAIFLGFELSRDDVHDATHRVGAVKKAGRATQHLYPIGNHRLVSIGYSVSEDALILRVSVDEHQHLSCAGTEAAHVDAT